jgi:integrase
MARINKNDSRSFSKNDVRFWLARVFKAKKVLGSRVYEGSFYSARFQHAGRRMAINLGTANQSEAAGRAKERYLFLVTNGWAAFDATYRADHDPVREPVELKTNVSVGEFLDAVINQSELSPTTIKPYAGSFRRIVAEIMRIKGGKKRFDYRKGGNQRWIEKVHAVRLADITPQKVSDWKKKFIARAGHDVIARKRAAVSCNSFVRQARALFSKRNVISKLRGIELPSVLPFDGVNIEKRTDTKFYGAGVDPHQLLRDAVAELGTKRVEELKAFLLALVMGLRRREADLLEWQSFDFAAGTVRIMPTRWYKLKTDESAAVLPLDPEIAALFKGWRAKAKTEFVIESTCAPKSVNYQWYRCESTFAALLDWLRSKGVQGNKPIHVLRKLYGSALTNLHGIHVASAGLRHSDIRTTSEFYSDRTVKLSAGFGSVLSGASVTKIPQPPHASQSEAAS